MGGDDPHRPLSSQLGQCRFMRKTSQYSGIRLQSQHLEAEAGISKNLRSVKATYPVSNKEMNYRQDKRLYTEDTMVSLMTLGGVVLV